MKGSIRRLRPSPAMVVACIALVFAMTGASYAAGMLGPNTVGTKQLKKNAVISSKVKNGSLLRADFKSGQIPAGPKGDKGDPGTPGAPGQQGTQGPPGPTASNFATAFPTAPPATGNSAATTTIAQPALGRLSLTGGWSLYGTTCSAGPCSVGVSIYLDGTFVPGSRRHFDFAGSGNSEVMTVFAQAPNVSAGSHTVTFRWDIGTGSWSGTYSDAAVAAIALGAATTSTPSQSQPTGSARIGS